MAIKLAILVAGDAERKAILSQPLGEDVTAVPLDNVRDLHKVLTREPFHGVVVDIRTKMQSSPAEKEVARLVQSIYPTVTFSRNAESGQVRVMYISNGGAPGSLRDFVDEECRDFRPRKIRSDTRRNINLNVRLIDPEKREAYRSATLDVSEGGCFVFSVAEWHPGRRVRLELHDLDSLPEVECDIRRVVPWGIAPTLPGVGLQFDQAGRQIIRSVLADLGK